MKFRENDEFGADLFQSGFEHGLTLDPLLACDLMEEFGQSFRGKDYKDIRDAALDKFLLAGDERAAYKVFLDRFYQRRAREAKKKKREPFAIPFAPR